MTDYKRAHRSPEHLRVAPLAAEHPGHPYAYHCVPHPPVVPVASEEVEAIDAELRKHAEYCRLDGFHGHYAVMESARLFIRKLYASEQYLGKQLVEAEAAVQPTEPR